MSPAPRAVAVLVMLAVILSGCGIIQRLTGEAARRQAREQAAKEQLQTLQQKVMRYADAYSERVARRTLDFADGLEGPARPPILSWRFSQVTAAVQIAAGPNPLTNAIDMVVLVSLARRIVATSWVARYGDAAQPVLRAYQSMEADAWQLLEGLLTLAQREEISRALDTWSADNPGVESAAFLRFADLAGVGPKAEARISPGLLGIIGLDPLEGIDPAVRVVAETRALAERALYYAQRLPMLLDLQIGEMLARFVQSPDARRILTAVDQVAQLSASVTRLSDETPALIAREREAAIAQVFSEFDRKAASCSQSRRSSKRPSTPGRSRRSRSTPPFSRPTGCCRASSPANPSSRRRSRPVRSTSRNTLVRSRSLPRPRARCRH
jgi:hypothetical protein